jgi:hypothetical protein
MKPIGKRGFTSHRPARLSETHRGRDLAMRVLFFGWLVLIATGLVFYSVIGLSHN